MSNKVNNNLDDKLKEIVAGEAYETRFGTTEISKEGIAQIKQAFVDEGYQRVGIVGNVIEQHVDYHEYIGANGKPNVRLMAGQEWLAKFMAEWQKQPNSGRSDDLNLFIYEAAKKAAGLNEQ
jgi:hypothetical protein